MGWAKIGATTNDFVNDYVYDAFDRMVARSVDSETEYHIYDGNRAALVLESDGDVVSRCTGPAISTVDICTCVLASC